MPLGSCAPAPPDSDWSGLIPPPSIGTASAPGVDGSNGGGLSGSKPEPGMDEQLAPTSGYVFLLIRSAVMNWSMRSSSTLSTFSWWPHDCTETGLSRPGYGDSSVYVSPSTLSFSVSTWS